MKQSPPARSYAASDRTSLCVSVFPRCGVNNLRNGTLHTKISYLLNNHTCVIIQNADEEECDSYWFVYIICIFIIFWVFRPCHSLSGSPGSQWQPHKTRGFYLVSSQSDNNLICAEIRWNRALNLLQLLIIIICKHKGQKQMLERERWGNRCYLLTKVSPVSVWSRTSSVPQPVHTQTEWMGMRKLTLSKQLKRTDLCFGVKTAWSSSSSGSVQLAEVDVQKQTARLILFQNIYTDQKSGNRSDEETQTGVPLTSARGSSSEHSFFITSRCVLQTVTTELYWPAIP